MKYKYLVLMVLCFAFAKIGCTQNLTNTVSDVSRIYGINNNTTNENRVPVTWEHHLKTDRTFTYQFNRKLKDQARKSFFAEVNHEVDKLLSPSPKHYPPNPEKT